MTYPENASIAESNCIIYRKGDRSRRLGMDFEPGAILSPYTSPALNFGDIATYEYRWEAVANQIDISFVVHQIGTSLFFYNAFATPLSSGLKSFSVDLQNFVAVNATDPKNCQLSFASGKGVLFCVGEQYEPFQVIYNPGTDSIGVSQIQIQIRDFLGVQDGLAVDFQPTTLTALHHYNLQNQGWVPPTNTAGVTPTGSITQSVFTNAVSPAGGVVGVITRGISTTTNNSASGADPIPAYFAYQHAYPSNNQVWWVAQDPTTGAFEPSLLVNAYFGSAQAAQGHFILNAFNQDRSAVSGITGIPAVINSLRPNSCAFFSGRIWYGCGSDLYYSQIFVQDTSAAGKCYQDADPTAQYISDLVATDGGQITIPEMGKVLKIIALGFGLLVLANNGVWFITGTSGGFTATDISIVKVTPIGVYGPNSVVEVVGTGRAGYGTKVYWWSPTGIQSANERMGAFGIITGSFDQENITLDTIQSLYNDIPEPSKYTVTGSYDKATNTITWLYNSGFNSNLNLYDAVLNLDLGLNAFYPWTISTGPSGPYLCGIFTNANIITVDAQPDIGHQVFNIMSCVVPNDNGTYNFTFCYIWNPSFGDWTTFDGVGLPYLSFVETGYELLEDAMRKKQATYVFTYFRQTEQNYVLGPNGDYTVDNPSSCLMQIKWDWTNSGVAGKWSTKREVYRLKHMPPPNEADLTLTTGYPVVFSKDKVRGSGKAIQFRFENDKLGSNFDLYGWAVEYSGNSTP